MSVHDQHIDAALNASIPGGSTARHWFLPHETEKGEANVREVVRLMLQAAIGRNKNPTNTMHTFGYDEKGEVTLRAARTSFDLSTDHRIAECALMFREAVVVRKQTNIDPFVLWEHIMGFKWVMPAGTIEVGEVAPIDMILYCPNCGVKHVDRADMPEDGADWKDPEIAWTNPPHRSHLCHGCGCIWRPADVPTNGVESITTKGKADSWSVEPRGFSVVILQPVVEKP